MSTESQQQIAREAADYFLKWQALSPRGMSVDEMMGANQKQLEQCILSTIERATEAKDKEIATHVVGMLERQAAAGQPLGGMNDQLANQLAVERQRHLAALKGWEKTVEQLLSAQAAIEKLVTDIKTCVEYPENHLDLESIDLSAISALRQHDAEVREPLVKALEGLREPPYHWNIARQIIDDALAKVKE